MASFNPRPIDTRLVTLPESLKQLSERLAENAHDVWAREKISDGWRYGSELDEESKTTPMLVPYSELPESVKEYDRCVSLETLKAICALGYRIQEPADKSL